MNRLIIALSAIVLSSPALAGWTYSGKSDMGTHYIDKSSIVQKKTTATMTVMFDLVRPERLNDGVLYRSFVLHEEFDCVNLRSRQLNTVGYTDPMGKGRNSGPGTDRAKIWEPVEMTDSSFVWRAHACNTIKIPNP